MTLDQIAIRHQTDKSSLVHGYTKIYEKYFEPLRNEPIKLLELGTGAYWKENEGFMGAKTWADYFGQAQIATVDIYPKKQISHPRVQFFQGSQDDQAFLEDLIAKWGVPDIIIDDCSHINKLTRASHTILFPLLKPGGIYVIEDVETSYWSAIAQDGTDFGGGINNPDAILNFLKTLVDNVNHKHSGLPDFGIESLHFHNNIVFLRKKLKP